jgi:DNA-binding transcriptional ArsR family regulator
MLPTHPSGALRESAPVFAALGDETRLGLVTRLSTGGPMSIARLASGSHVSRQAVTKHLRVLADAHLARSARLGRETIWELDRYRLDEARAWIDQIGAQWDDALNRLRLFVEGPEPTPEPGRATATQSPEDRGSERTV